MKNIVVVDFDECLCSVNSFRYWLVYSLVFLLLRLRLITLLYVVQVCVARVFGITGRLSMKKDVLKYTQDSPEWMVRLFCKFLHLKTDEKVMAKMTEYKQQGMDIVLNTAAPLFYIKVYAGFFNFTHVIASENISTGEWVENFGIEKLTNLNSLYSGCYNLQCVITDHMDDLPLMSHAKSVLLVCPDEDTLIGLRGIINYQLL